MENVDVLYALGQGGKGLFSRLYANIGHFLINVKDQLNVPCSFDHIPASLTEKHAD